MRRQSWNTALDNGDFHSAASGHLDYQLECNTKADQMSLFKMLSLRSTVDVLALPRVS